MSAPSDKFPTEFTWRELGCSECSRDFEKDAPFVHHETDGSVGGPWCIKCAVEKYGFGGRDPNHHFIIHDADEEVSRRSDLSPIVRIMTIDGQRVD